MAGERFRVSLVWVAVLLMGTPGLCARGGQSEEQLQQHIQSEQNPVKKAKAEIKLARLKLAQINDEYSQGHIESGAKLLSAFLTDMKNSWKVLHESGRKATKQPEGFRQLEITLREEVRCLEDLGRTVSYFDRAPVLNAAQELDRMHSEVLQELFPEDPPRTRKGSTPRQADASPDKY